MSDHTDTNLLSAGRAFLYRLLKAFFITEPNEESYKFLKSALEIIQQNRINSRFDQSVRDLLEYLKNGIEEIQKEHYHLFVDPYSESQVPLTVSMYLEGRNYSKTLAEVKETIAEAGIEAREGIDVPEDYIPFLFEVMEVLISENSGTHRIQETIFKGFLLPSVNGLADQLKQKGQGFYNAVGHFLDAYIVLEKEYFEETKGNKLPEQS